ncbi:MAG: phage holin family protein [Rhodoglobus sp.]|uniref:phage holin family protein n=1 Tax=uncultured Salinibacterium sp. TaxID=459274 RepID=UPI0030D8C829|tara:strand:+ start:61615 stop:62043 length:429 start_codon:yes stop_codon:yes gene_type:complete
MHGESPKTDPQREPKRSLAALIADVPRLLGELIRGEIESLKNEMVGKLKNAGIGIGLFVGAAFFALFALMVLIAAAVLGFAEIVPAWAAALIVAGILLVIVAILVAVGVTLVKKGTPPAPTDTIESIKSDVRAIKGTRKRRS